MQSSFGEVEGEAPMKRPPALYRTHRLSLRPPSIPEQAKTINVPEQAKTISAAPETRAIVPLIGNVFLVMLRDSSFENQAPTITAITRPYTPRRSNEGTYLRGSPPVADLGHTSDPIKTNT
jgi:hypothetical protein